MDIQREDLERYWWTHSNSQIAKELKTTEYNVYRWARLHDMPDRRARADTLGPAPDDPSEEDIAERAAAIRASWTEQERAARQVGAPRRPTPWEIPRFRFTPQRSAMVLEVVRD